MLHLAHVIDKATGCIFVPPASVGQPPDTVDASDKPSSDRPNTYALMTSAAGPMHGPRSDVRDVQERWIDAREEYDAFEKKVKRAERKAKKATMDEQTVVQNEQEMNKMLMSNKQRKLYEKMKYSEKKRAAEVCLSLTILTGLIPNAAAIAASIGAKETSH